MTPDRLLSAIRADLDDTERLAHAAAERSHNWRYDGTSPFGPRVIVGDDEDDLWQRECNPSVWTCDDELDGCPAEARGWIAEGRHIARHDPATVRRWVAAMREIAGKAESMSDFAAREPENPALPAMAAAYEDVLRALARGLGIDPASDPPSSHTEGDTT